MTVKTTPISLKLPTDLHERLKARAAEAGTSVTALLIDGVTTDAQPDLLAQIAKLTTERDQWRDKAKAIVGAAAATKRVRDPDPQGRAVKALMGNPVFEPKLSVQGDAPSFFKKNMKASAWIVGPGSRPPIAGAAVPPRPSAGPTDGDGCVTPAKKSAKVSAT